MRNSNYSTAAVSWDLSCGPMCIISSSVRMHNEETGLLFIYVWCSLPHPQTFTQRSLNWGGNMKMWIQSLVQDVPGLQTVRAGKNYCLLLFITFTGYLLSLLRNRIQYEYSYTLSNRDFSACDVGNVCLEHQWCRDKQIWILNPNCKWMVLSKTLLCVPYFSITTNGALYNIWQFKKNYAISNFVFPPRLIWFSDMYFGLESRSKCFLKNFLKQIIFLHHIYCKALSWGCDIVSLPSPPHIMLSQLLFYKQLNEI